MRKILHVDMDAFYASVEQRDDPDLAGRPVVVGGPPRSRGVVCAASYEARRYGVRSAMPSAQAARLCPDAVFVAPDFAKYRVVSDQIRAVFLRYTDLVEPLSLDEAYLDVTENRPRIPYATRVAREIRAAIRAETGLTASAGVAPNKFIAKVASDAHKPDGLTVVTPERVEEFLRALPVRKLPGVGPVTAARFERLGIRVVSEIARLADLELVQHFGKGGLFFRDLARGVDPRPVEPDRARRSVGIEDTFASDVSALDEAVAHLEALAAGLERRLEGAGERGRTLTLKVKYHDFRVSTRSRTLARPIAGVAEVMATARALLGETDVGRVPVRLLGLSVSSLGEHEHARQLVLPFGA